MAAPIGEKEMVCSNRCNKNNFQSGKQPESTSLSNKVGNNQLKTVQNDAEKTIFKCLECPFAFYRKSLLEQHISLKHSAGRCFKCERCHQVFYTSLRYKSHCETKHGVTHPYKCEKCGNSFVRESGLKVHLKVHENNRSFACEICGMSFNQKSTLLTHKQRLHSVTGEFKCDQCGKTFNVKIDLATHSRIHKEKIFKCEVCGRVFQRNSNLSRHKRQHTGEKPYQCKHCSKAFARPENCTEHERVHTNDKPYVCPLCGARYSDSGNFSNHKKNTCPMLDKKIASKKVNVVRRTDVSLKATNKSQIQIDFLKKSSGSSTNLLQASHLKGNFIGHISSNVVDILNNKASHEKPVIETKENKEVLIKPHIKPSLEHIQINDINKNLLQEIPECYSDWKFVNLFDPSISDLLRNEEGSLHQQSLQSFQSSYIAELNQLIPHALTNHSSSESFYQPQLLCEEQMSAMNDIEDGSTALDNSEVSTPHIVDASTFFNDDYLKS